MRRELRVSATVTFDVTAKISFDGTKEQFAELSEEERMRIAFPALERAFDPVDNCIKDGELVLTQVSEGDEEIELG